MGSSFVNIRDHGFWVHDSLLEPWLRLLALHLREPDDHDTPAAHATMEKIRNNWLLVSKGYFGGWIGAALEEATSTDEGKSLVRGAIQSLLEALSQAPTVLPRNTLKLLGFAEHGYEFDIETRHLVEIGNAFLDLVDGKIISKAGDRARMPGAMQ